MAKKLLTALYEFFNPKLLLCGIFLISAGAFFGWRTNDFFNLVPMACLSFGGACVAYWTMKQD